MRYRRLATGFGLVLAMVALSTGCVSKKAFRSNVDESASRMDSVESGIESNERRIGSLRDETDSKIAALEGRTDEAVNLGRTAAGDAADAKQAAERASLGRLLWSVTLSDDRVKFSFDQSNLPGEARSMLEDLAERVKSYGKAVYLEIEGHTDSTGSEAYNYTLGLRRANAVRDYLNRSGGIPLHAMSTISLGEGNPVADNSSSTGRSQNRRVVVRVLE